MTNRDSGIKPRSLFRQDATLQDILDLFENPERYDGLALVKLPVCLRITAVKADDVRSCSDFYTTEKVKWYENLKVNFVDYTKKRTLRGMSTKIATNLGLTPTGLKVANELLNTEKHPDHENIRIRTATDWSKTITVEQVCSMVTTFNKLENLQRNLSDLTMQLGEGLPATVLAIAAKLNFQPVINYSMMTAVLNILPKIDPQKLDDSIAESDSELEKRLIEETTRNGFFTVTANAPDVTDPSTLVGYNDPDTNNSMRHAYIKNFQDRFLPKKGYNIDCKAFFTQLNRVIDAAPEKDLAQSDIVARVISTARDLLVPSNQQSPRVKRIMEEIKIRIFLWKYESTYAPLQFLDNNPWAQTNAIVLLTIRGRIPRVETYETLMKRMEKCALNTSILVTKSAFTESESFMDLRNLFVSWQNRSPELFGNLKNFKKPITGGIIQKAEEANREKGGNMDLLGLAIKRVQEPRLRLAVNKQAEKWENDSDAQSTISHEASMLEFEFCQKLKRMRSKVEPFELIRPIRNTAEADMMGILLGDDRYESDESTSSEKLSPKKKSKTTPRGNTNIAEEFESMSMSSSSDIDNSQVEIEDFSIMTLDGRNQPDMPTVVPLANCLHTFGLMKENPFKRLLKARNVPISAEHEVDQIPPCAGNPTRPICGNPITLFRESIPINPAEKYYCRFCKKIREGTMERNIELEKKLANILNPENAASSLRSVIMGKIRVTIPTQLIENVKIPPIEARNSKIGFLRALENTWSVFSHFSHQQKLLKNPSGNNKFNEELAVEELGPAPRSAVTWERGYINTISILHTGGFKPENEQDWANVLAHFRDVILRQGHFLIEDFTNEPGTGMSGATMPPSNIQWGMQGVARHYPVTLENGSKMPIFWCMNIKV